MCYGYFELEESDAQLKATFEQKACWNCTYGMDGHYLLVNQRFCEIVGYTEEELLRMRNQDVLEPSELSRLQFSIDQVTVNLNLIPWRAIYTKRWKIDLGSGIYSDT